MAHNRVVCAGHDLDGTEDSFATRVELDIEGNQRAVRDERNCRQRPADRRIEQRIVMRYAYDMLGNRIHQLSMEAGARWMLNDVAGKPIRAWDSRGHNFVTAYDALRRPVEQSVRGTTAESDPRTLNRDILVDKIEYGEGQANAEALNLRTRIYRHFDSAGVVTNARLDADGNPTEAYDFKGNLLRSTRRLVSDYTAIPDWLLNPQLDAETFEQQHPLRRAQPPHPVHRAAQQSRPRQTQRHPAGVQRGQPAGAGGRVAGSRRRTRRVCSTLPWTRLHRSASANIDYDAKGQRQRIDYKNGASTFYDYDPLTFRLVHLLTRRDAAAFPDATDPHTAPAPAGPGMPGAEPALHLRPGRQHHPHPATTRSRPSTSATSASSRATTTPTTRSTG